MLLFLGTFLRLMILSLPLLLPAADAAAPSDPAALQATAAAALAAYYSPNANGAIPDKTSAGADARQWYESGVMWGALMESIAASRSTALAPLVATAISNASYAPIGVGSFLGPDRSIAAIFLGRWNDDIAWFGLAAVTAASVFGPTALAPNSRITYLQIATQTFTEIWEDWDATTCGGGIFWSRDRTKPKIKDYKSTISNGQTIILGARLAILTGDTTYADKAAQVYTWLKSSSIINPSNQFIRDGLYISNNCTIDIMQYSYNAGTIIAGLAWLYKATANTQYITEADPLLTTSLTIFTKTDIITDLCEGFTGTCTDNDAVSIAPRVNVTQYKGMFIRCLMYYHAITPNPTQKTLIETVINTSYNAMVSTCDNTTNCLSVWTPVSSPSSSTFHTHMVAVELFNAMVSIHSNVSMVSVSGYGSDTFTVLDNPVGVVMPGNGNGGGNGGTSSTSSSVSVSGGRLSWLGMLVGVCICFIMVLS